MSIHIDAYVRYGYFYENEALNEIVEDPEFEEVLAKYKCGWVNTDPMGDGCTYVIYHNDLEYGCHVDDLTGDREPMALPDVLSGCLRRQQLLCVKKYLSKKGVKPHQKGNRLAWQFTVEVG